MSDDGYASIDQTPNPYLFHVEANTKHHAANLLNLGRWKKTKFDVGITRLINGKTQTITDWNDKEQNDIQVKT